MYSDDFTLEQLQAAVMDGVVIAHCPDCGTDLEIEPDAESTWCGCCDKLVQPKDSLRAKGLI